MKQYRVVKVGKVDVAKWNNVPLSLGFGLHYFIIVHIKLMIIKKTFARETEQWKWSPDAINEAAAKVRDKEMSLGEADVNHDILKAALLRRARKDGDNLAKRLKTIQPSFID